ncbi:histidine kinase [Actinomyces massiliensis]|uniref:histidine kinase n=1 Tax=Actinomyces massiliensis F0489 TaxID=1125718 RepID=J1HN76_9ACTO|nr:histidine kinase [Actinomyces massiliensis]EJF47455.1 histidine kinase dimerization/phosphoacceptor domain protein [Actinomyces massiliensis F0489]WLD70713.1 histidine kinase [Actinomyces massiliensis]
MTRTVGRFGRLPDGWDRPDMADVLLSVLLGFFSMANPLGTSRLSGLEGSDGSAAIVVFYGITAVCCTAIALRRLHPVAPVCSVCAIGVALTVHLAVFADASVLALVSCLLAAETTQSRIRRPWSLVLLTLIYAGIVPAACRAGETIDPQATGGSVNRLIIPIVTGWALVSVTALVGASRRRARERVEQALERAAILRAQQDTERRLAVVQERQRIARDVHDLVGHSLSVIGMQAAGARAVLASDPGAADAALAVIGETSRRAVDEVRALVDVLRTDEDPPPAVKDTKDIEGIEGIEDVDRTTVAVRPGAMPAGRDVEPVLATVGEASPGLEEVPVLIARARRAGLPVSLSLSQTGDVDPEVGRAVYRCVQEALTNVMRHAAGAPTAVALSVGDALEAVVTNEKNEESYSDGAVDAAAVAPASPGAGPHADGERSAGTHRGGRRGREGTGLASMEERLADVGGSLEVGPTPTGGWRVRMSVPAAVASRGDA